MSIWCEEVPSEYAYWGYKIALKRTYECFQSKFQEVAVHETEGFGRVLTLDGVIQLSEYDEPHYHEMFVHVPALSHPNPTCALVVGGGDGGIVRELLKYPSIKEIHFCEIDEAVVQMAVKYFPKTSVGVGDPRVKTVFEDGTVYIKNFKKKFDLILVDSTDPKGPGKVLFEEPFYSSAAAALTEKGIMATQADTWGYPKEREFIKKMFEWTPSVFKYRGYYNAMVPTYPSGNIGLGFYSNGINPYEVTPDAARMPQDLWYYTPEIHKAAFVLPRFADKFLNVSKA